MSRKRAKSLKLDQVINLILDDTVSSSSSESEWNSDDQSEKYQHRQETDNKKKCQSVTNSDDDDDDVPLWKLANKSKNTPIEEDESSNNSDDVPLSKLANQSKDTPLKADESSNNSDDILLSALTTKRQSLGVLCLNSSTKQNKTANSPKKTNKKLTKCLLRGIYDFMESQAFLVNSGSMTDEASSSEGETNENSDYFNTDYHCDSENNLRVGRKVLKCVQASPAIKMECRKEDKYYMSLKNLKRKKIF